MVAGRRAMQAGRSVNSQSGAGGAPDHEVSFSNRPFEVKRFQTIHHRSVDVARGLVLLSGIGTRALVWGFRCQGVRQAAKLSFFGFLVRSQSPFLRPDLRIADVDARRVCTRLAVTPTLRHASPLPGHTLTASSTTAR